MKNLIKGLIVLSLSLVLGGCGQQKTEFTMDELAPALFDLQKCVDDKSKYLTSDEKYSTEKLIPIYNEAIDETDFPIKPGTEVEVRGVVANNQYGSKDTNCIFYVSNIGYDEKKDDTMPCILPRDEFKKCFTFKEDTPICIRGTFMKSSGDDTGLFMTDCEVTSPNINFSLKTNVDGIEETLSSEFPTEAIVTGYIDSATEYSPKDELKTDSDISDIADDKETFLSGFFGKDEVTGSTPVSSFDGFSALARVSCRCLF